jgi:hypothetical protein
MVVIDMVGVRGCGWEDNQLHCELALAHKLAFP